MADEGTGGTGGEGTGGTPPPAAAAPADWTASLDADMKGYVQNKGFKEPSDVLSSYRNFEKLMGAPKERLLTLPEKEDAPEWASVYDRLGRPKEAKEYNIEVPKEVGDEKFAGWAKETFHKLGLTKAQGEKLAAEWNNQVQGATAAQVEAHNAKVMAEEGELKKTWGAAFDQNQTIAKRAVQEFGVTPEQVDVMEKAIGFAGTMKFFHNLGSKLSEHSFATPTTRSGFNGVLTPEAAMNKINSLKQDSEFSSKLVAGNSDARELWDRLHQWAVPSS